MSQRDEMATMIETTFTEGIEDGMTPGEIADLIVSVIREHLMASIENDGLATVDQVSVQSIVGGSTGEPYVQCRVGKESWQWTVSDAREHALGLLQCAEAASHDAAMMRWLVLDDKLGLDKATALGALRDLRRFRGDVALEVRRQ